ncbi:DUF4269 domain-containing protein [Anaerobacillus alkaliphilus]|uniref:DUF4269 domain-containing protein n=1 Tax=Anaerobacillus alkaliphilus TaxID=1548597 RepID=A0A4Q0VL63_9BACI|nr:DUF4269 domain-containing protein [Anaerobacillus alkaliphilus]RXI96148.1 DUF4269 domain-containing protein [Anaerobacillus alkaliphilus]
MFTSIDYLKLGNERQRRAYDAIQKVGIMDNLAIYTPILCGTLPIGIDVDGSDLDIIMEVHNFSRFREQVKDLYSHLDNYRLKEVIIRDVPVVKANFLFEGYEFELFGQPQPVFEQNAYLHMIIEDQLIKCIPTLRDQVISLKQRGYKTEPAFCKVLGLDESDPYLSLINYGRNICLI